MPFVWDMARYCLDLPEGRVRHFPAGTYREQMATATARAELDLMTVVYSAWYVFKHLSAGDWQEDDRRFVKWVAEDPKLETPQWKLDDYIMRLWKMAWWTLRMLSPKRDSREGDS